MDPYDIPVHIPVYSIESFNEAEERLVRCRYGSGKNGCYTMHEMAFRSLCNGFIIIVEEIIATAAMGVELDNARGKILPLKIKALGA